MIRQAATISVPRLRMAATIALHSHNSSNINSHRILLARTLVSKAPGNDPLDVLRKDSLQRKHCDLHGYRQPGVHWVMALAMLPTQPDGSQAPNLRTVGIQKVGPSGIDFVTKAGSKIAETLAQEQLVSILNLQGKYKPGESATQWRGDGHCEKIPLEDLLHCLPHYSVTGMVVAKRIEQEGLDRSAENLGDNVSSNRLAVLDKNHVTEITQRTRLELENDQISREELNSSIQAFRFCPDRMERMHGGPDSILWERWEWLRLPSGDGTEEAIPWAKPTQLLSH